MRKFPEEDQSFKGEEEVEAVLFLKNGGGEELLWKLQGKEGSLLRALSWKKLTKCFCHKVDFLKEGVFKYKLNEVKRCAK